MKLGIVNGSPRGRKSNSDGMIKWLTSDMEETNQIQKVYAADVNKHDEAIRQISGSDYLIFIFPLYTDAMPGLSKAFMEKMEQNKNKFKDMPVVFIIHSGFPEATHSRTVERYVEYFAKIMGMKYMGTIIMGGSEGVRIAPKQYFGGKVREFKKLGLNIVNLEPLAQNSLKIISHSENLSELQLFISKFVKISDFYWNRSLKKNGAYDKRFDRPYS